MYFRTKEEVPLSKLKHAEAELKFHKERIAVIVREITEQLSPEILEECGPEEKATFLKHHEIWKGEKPNFKVCKGRGLLIERFSIECRKTKTKPISYQLDL